MAPRKNPNTLDRVSRDATYGRAEFKRSVRYELHSQRGKRYTDIGKITLEIGSSLRGATSDELLAASREHYLEHQSEYHDLAVLQAHLEGISIAVEKPILVGHRAETRYSQQA